MAYADYTSEVEIIFNDQTKRVNLVACFTSSTSQTQIKNTRVFQVYPPLILAASEYLRGGAPSASRSCLNSK